MSVVAARLSCGYRIGLWA